MKILLVPVEKQKELEEQRKKLARIPPEKISQKLLSRIIGFANLLRKNRVPVHTVNEIDAISALNHIDINNRFEFYHALKANMIASRKHFAVFDHLFLTYWRTGVSMPKRYGGETEEPDEGDSSVHKESGADKDEDVPSRKDSKKRSNIYEEITVPTHSLTEALKEKDFEDVTDHEVALFDEVFKNLRVNVKEKKGRRYKPCSNGKIVDLKRSIRQSTQKGGDIIKIYTKMRKPRQSKLVLLADVSGSMDIYSRFLIKFIFGLQKQLRDTETFVFGTKILRITDVLSYRSLQTALFMLSAKATFWSGGTDIGGCLTEFNHAYGPKLRKRNRILVILSDGWDRGDTENLKKQMAILKRGFKKIVWLNPNLKYDEYKPLCMGMSAAMPYIDHFLPCHNLKTLEKFIEVVKNI